jgi:predicted permease
MLVIAMIAFVLLVFYLFSIFYMEDRRVEKRVKANLLTLVIIYCPIINTVLTIYFMNKNADYKKSIEKLFND